MHVSQGQDISGACGQLVVQHSTTQAAKSDAGALARPSPSAAAAPLADIEEVGGGGMLKGPVAALKALFV